MKVGMERVAAPDFIADGPSSVEIRPRNVLAGLLLTLSYQWNVAGGTGIGAIFADAHARLIDRVDIGANGQDVQTYSGQFLELYNLLFLRETLEQTPPTLLAAGTAQAAREAVWLLPFIMGHSLSPGEFALPTRGVREPTLTVHWARAIDMVDNVADGVASISAASTRMAERYMVDPEVPPGGFSPLLIKQQTLPVVGSGELEVRLNHLLSGANGARGHELRAIFLEAFSGGVLGKRFEYDNDVVGEIRLSIGSRPVFEQTVFNDQRQINKANYGLATRATGVVVLDASADDLDTRKGKLWDVVGTERPILRLDTVQQGAGENRIRVTTVHTARR